MVVYNVEIKASCVRSGQVQTTAYSAEEAAAFVAEWLDGLEPGDSVAVDVVEQ